MRTFTDCAAGWRFRLVAEYRESLSMLCKNEGVALFVALLLCDQQVNKAIEKIAYLGILIGVCSLYPSGLFGLAAFMLPNLFLFIVEPCA